MLSDQFRQDFQAIQRSFAGADHCLSQWANINKNDNIRAVVGVIENFFLKAVLDGQQSKRVLPSGSKSARLIFEIIRNSALNEIITFDEETNTIFFNENVSIYDIKQMHDMVINGPNIAF